MCCSRREKEDMYKRGNMGSPLFYIILTQVHLERFNFEVAWYWLLKGLLYDSATTGTQSSNKVYSIYFQFTVYSIGREHNGRWHGEVHQTVTHLQGYIDKSVQIESPQYRERAIRDMLRLWGDRSPLGFSNTLIIVSFTF